MIGEQSIRRILEEALVASKADQTEVVLQADHSALTRFANSSIHQNVAETDVDLRIRVVFGKRIGVAVTDRLSHDAITKAVEAASMVARLSGENPDFISLPGPQPSQQIQAWVESTAQCPAERRAQYVGIICHKADEAGFKAAGALETGGTELAVANSLGTFAYHRLSFSSFETVVMSDDSSGYAERAALDLQSIDAEAMANEAVGKARQSRNPIDLQPGIYEVVLEPYAVHDILDHVGRLGFNALLYQDGRGFTVDRLGKTVAAPIVSIRDDGLDCSGLPLPFDFEGVPKRRVDMIKAGVANELVFDSFTANRGGVSSTGHALPAPNPGGPLPINTFMDPGAAKIEEMIAKTEHGVLVTRIHYSNPVDPKRAIITGMTRDGTFLIEHGQITRPVKNLRFTQSYLEALLNVTMIGDTALLHREWLGGISAPAIKVNEWQFQ